MNQKFTQLIKMSCLAFFIALLCGNCNSFTPEQHAYKAIASYLQDRQRVADDTQLLQALDILSQNRTKQNARLIASLLYRVEQEDSKIAYNALYALAQIKNTDSITPIIHYTINKSPRDYLVAVEAIRSIQNKKASSWLFTLSTGHPDPDVREAAKKALEEIEFGRP